MIKYLIATLGLLLILAMWRIDNVTASRDAARDAVTLSDAKVSSLRVTLRLSRELLGDRDAIDTKATQELNDAKARIDQLHDDIRAGKRRLSVAARCPSVRAAGDTGAASMDDAAARAELDPAAAGRIIRITDDGDQGLIALRGLQDYITNVCLRQASED